MMDWNWGGDIRPESARYWSSVRIVLRERLAAAMSGILGGFWGVMGWEGCEWGGEVGWGV